MVDLSATGMRVRSLVVFDIEASVETTLVLPDNRRIPLRGQVVWRNLPAFELGTPGEFGMELTEPPAEYLSALAGLFADED